MNTIKSLFFWGLLTWLIPFLAGLILFPIRTSDRPFFESIMPVVIALTTAISLFQYQKHSPINSARDRILVGLLWLGVSITVDLLLFSWGPMKMAFADYWKDIGFTYLLIPIITFGVTIRNNQNIDKPEKNIH